MIEKNSLVALSLKDKVSLEYEFTEKWLEETVEPFMIAAAKEGKTEYDFVVHVSEASPGVIRKVLIDKGYGVLMWAHPIDAKPPVTRFTIKVLW